MKSHIYDTKSRYIQYEERLPTIRRANTYDTKNHYPRYKEPLPTIRRATTYDTKSNYLRYKEPLPTTRKATIYMSSSLSEGNCMWYLTARRRMAQMNTKVMMTVVVVSKPSNVSPQ